MIEPVKNRGGRPPQGPKSGKGATLATRITAETREAIEAEAVRTGRSISQVAEMWLEEARKGRADYLSRMGGNTALAAAVETLVEAWRQIEAMIENPNEQRVATSAAWGRLAPLLVPPPFFEGNLHFARAELEFWSRCDKVLNALRAAGPDDQAYQKALEPLIEHDDILSNGKRLADRLADALESRGVRDFDAALAALDQLGPVASPAIAELISTAVAAAATYIELKGKVSERAGYAKLVGEIVAGRLLDPEAYKEPLAAFGRTAK